MGSFEDIVAKAKEYCSKKVSETAYSMWIENLRPVDYKDDRVILAVTNSFQKGIIDQKYEKLLEEAFESALGFPSPIEIITEAPPKEEKTPTYYDNGSGKIESASAQMATRSPLNGEYEYTFDTFIVGASNKFAHAASLAVATSPSGSYNPLFIYGSSGLGKTHLLFAIYNEITKNEQNKPQKERKKLVYVKGEEFTNELIDAIRNQTTDKFHSTYRQIDVLLVDDIQFIAGKEQTQQEFFHTFESLYQAKKQIVLTSDRPPKEIKTLEERLSSRFESGLLADVSAPDFETRIAIIQRKAELLNLAIPYEVVEYIANRLKTNIRQLEGAVKKLEAYQHLAHTEPSIAVAQNAIRDILNDDQPVTITVERIVEEVGRTYGISPEDIRSGKRTAPISSSRQIAMYVVREITQMSTSAIGEAFGGRDHSTVVYAIQQVEKTMKQDQRYRETIEDIVKNIRDR